MPRIKVSTLNLFNRMGDWDSRMPLVIDQLDALSPDVIGLQEVDLGIDQGMEISRAINRRVGERPHYRIKHATSPGVRAAIFGIGTMARIECLEHEVLDLMTFDRIAQRMVYQAEGVRFAFVNTHLHHPPEATAERTEQAEYLLRWLDSHEKLPTIVSGDFNSYPGEPVIDVMKSRFRSACGVANGCEPEKTWPTPVNTYDDSPPGTLDYIYVSPEFQVAEAGLAFDMPSPANPDLFPSDHLGLYAVLDLNS
ncbi:MAG TPA: endonuclease/exonuclease/phosphatase family protein [Dehalococcoidia bacterium]|nr:endonuclease/exonuclease/phosphatase family protein [Dehalococcoidia bacterium]